MNKKKINPGIERREMDVEMFNKFEAWLKPEERFGDSETGGLLISVPGKRLLIIPTKEIKDERNTKGK